MKLVAALPFLALPVRAFAHPGHFAESSGHTHWLALAALAGIIAVACAAIVRRTFRRRHFGRV